MLTYVIRRLLYSIVVLILAELPRLLRSSPRARATRSRRSRMHAERDPRHDQNASTRRSTSTIRSPCATGTGCKDAVTNEFGTTLLTNKPILPDLWRVMKNTLQLVFVAELLAILLAIGHRRALGLTPVLAPSTTRRRRSASSGSRRRSSGWR